MRRFSSVTRETGGIETLDFTSAMPTMTAVPPVRTLSNAVDITSGTPMSSKA